MNNRPLVAVALGCAVAAFASLPSRSVYACSAGPDWNPVEESDLIIAGTIRGWETAPPPDGLPEDFPFETVRLAIDVEDVLKGEAPARIEAIDTASLDSATMTWHGGSGACGALDADPTGQYVFMGLSYDDAGNLRTNRLLVFYIGTRAEFASFRADRTAEILTSFGLTRLPSTGNGGLVGTSAPDKEVLTIATLLIALGVGGLSLLRRTA